MPPKKHQAEGPEQALCDLLELAAGGARGFRIERAGRQRAVFVVRRGDAVYGYLNSCPHTGVMLDWSPDRFLDAGGELIVCATHGARFRIEDGLCVSGPCLGERLTEVEVRISDGMCLLKTASLPD